MASTMADLNTMLLSKPKWLATAIVGVGSVFYFLCRRLSGRKKIDEDTRIVIIGAGMSGICMGYELLKQGHTNFVIYEKATRVGGTWSYNRYPGCGCDIPAPLYSFSFASWPEWDRLWAKQAQIQQYNEWVVRKFGLEQYIKLNTHVESCVWDERANEWHIRCVEGGKESLEREHKIETRARYLINAMGPLRVPRYPNLPGIQQEGNTVFEGESIHSTCWPKDKAHSLKGKRVGVIGTGASAVQLIPEVAKEAKHLVVFQRTPPYIFPKEADTEFGAFSKWLRRLLVVGNAVMYAQRLLLYWAFEVRLRNFYPGSGNTNARAEILEKMREELGKDAPKDLIKKLTPTYPIGCKRVLIYSGYFSVFLKPNVTLCVQPIKEITASGIRVLGREHKGADDGEGSEGSKETDHKLDAIIYATGFQVMSTKGLHIAGAKGYTLEKYVNENMRSLHGVMAEEFPNMFFLLGPNTGLGHNTVVWMVECQTAYIYDLLSQLSANGLTRVTPKAARVSEFMEYVDVEHSKKVWSECSSWYRHPTTGNVFALWPSSTVWYWWKTLRARLSDYDVSSDS